MTQLSEQAGEQRRIWEMGRFRELAGRNVLTHELLARAVDVHPGDRVLDVGAGAGNAGIAAARRGGVVTAVDLVGGFLEIALERAAAECLTLAVQVADAQDLPFQEGAFDVVLSSFAVMFAPDPERAAAELLRVCRPGGRIGLTSWVPGGYVGHNLAVLAGREPGRDGADPLEWGVPGRLRELFGDRVTELRTRVRTVEMCHPSAAAAVRSQRETLGPVRALYDSLTPADQQVLAAELVALTERFNRATDGTAVIQADYLETVIIR